MLTVQLRALALTLLFELCFALLWGARGRRELRTVVLANCLTNPPAVLLYWLAAGFWGWPRGPTAAALETAAVLIEWRCYRACAERLRRPLLFSLLANGFSYGAGRLLQFLF